LSTWLFVQLMTHGFIFDHVISRVASLGSGLTRGPDVCIYIRIHTGNGVVEQRARAGPRRTYRVGRTSGGTERGRLVRARCFATIASSARPPASRRDGSPLLFTMSLMDFVVSPVLGCSRARHLFQTPPPPSPPPPGYVYIYIYVCMPSRVR